jgi:predicted ester cyclase
MSTEETNKAAVRRYIDAVNDKRLEELDEIVDANYAERSNVPGLPPGLAGFKAAHTMLHESFPDLKFTIDDMIAEGDKVVLRATGSGTNTGAFFGMPPTGKKVTWTGSRFMRFADGKMVSGAAEFDQLGILKQLGVIPDQPPPDSGQGGS